MLKTRISAKHLLATVATLVGLGIGLSSAHAETKIRFSNDWKWAMATLRMLILT